MDEKKANPRSDRDDAGRDDDARRESGEPGGGAGRRDEVGKSGVYPMSGGLPKGKHPEIRTPASWGQGDRGSAGYEDSGRSGLVWKDGQLLGGMSSADSAGDAREESEDEHRDRPEKMGDASNK